MSLTPQNKKRAAAFIEIGASELQAARKLLLVENAQAAVLSFLRKNSAI